MVLLGFCDGSVAAKLYEYDETDETTTVLQSTGIST